MADMELTIGIAVEKLELVVNKLLNCPFRGVAASCLFEQEVIDDLRQVASETTIDRRKKNLGVIGGSSAGIVGGAMSIAGAALIPFTFGTSLGLLITGLAVSVTGASVSMGFSINKNLKDKKKISILKPALERFIEFQKKLANSMVTIRLCEQLMSKVKESGLGDVKLRPQNEMNLAVTHLLDEVEALHHIEDDKRSLDGKMNDIMRHAKTMEELLVEILQPIKAVFGSGDSSFEKSLENAEKNPFNMLARCLQSGQDQIAMDDENPTTFISFVQRYLNVTSETDESSSKLPVGIGVDAAGNLVAKGGIAGGRVALRAFDTADNLAQVGGNVLKVAKGVSVAGIILGAVGVAVDVGFLGHAIYDLQKKDVDKLSQAFTDLADAMEEINTISMVK